MRREQLRNLAQYTGRSLVIYVVDFLDPGRAKAPGATGIDHSDKLGFIEVIRRLQGSVDVLIESPGGAPEATEALVRLLRGKFEDVRFIVPNVAKSAATMFALSGNALVLDAPSELGPIDPQMILQRDWGIGMSPAHAIIEQFEQAKDEIKEHPERLPAWIPILNQYGPSLLVECEAAIALAQRLVTTWMETYMFANDRDRRRKARRIAKYLSAYDEHLSHGRPIGMRELKDLGVKIVDMSADPGLRERIWNVYNSIVATWVGTGAYKIFENHLDDCLVRMAVQMQIAIPMGMPPQLPLPLSPRGA